MHLLVADKTVPSQGRESIRAARRERMYELGLGLLIIAVPLAFLPASFSPFSDLKLVLLMAGTCLLFAGGSARSNLARPAAIWLGVNTVAAFAGVDWWRSLLGRENAATGLIMILACVLILVVASGVPHVLRDRIPYWLTGTATAVGLIALAYRFASGVFAHLIPHLKFDGSTLGQPVFLSAFMAVGIVACTGAYKLRSRWMIPAVVIMSSALAISTKRVGWVALIAGFAVIFLRSHDHRKLILRIGGIVSATLIVWTVLSATISSSIPLSGADRFTQLSSDSAHARVMASQAMFRGWQKRPILGWGPSNSWSAYLSSAGAADVSAAHRGMEDAHNILMEVLVTSGVIGLGAFTLLGALAVREIRNGPTSLGWAAGAATSLAVLHMLQPLNVALTPLLFLLAGLATIRPAKPLEERHGRSAGRMGTWLVLSVCIGLASAFLASAIFEQYGRTYSSTFALRRSLLFDPRRVTASEDMALQLALDGRSSPVFARATCETIERVVREHPWNPDVRIWAADSSALLRDYAGAGSWIRGQLARFPNDDLAKIKTPQPHPGDAAPLARCSSTGAGTPKVWTKPN